MAVIPSLTEAFFDMDQKRDESPRLRFRQRPGILRRMMKRISLCRVLAAVAFISAATGVSAQDLEPRSYSNTPVGLNFLLAGYRYSEGKIAFDPSTSITDAQYHNNVLAVAYARSLDAWGNSAKFDVVVPYSSFSGSALAGGQIRYRDMEGLGDPLFRFSMNFYGAPALSMKEFAGYRQDVIIGASVQVSAPMGQYDNSKLLNLGENRWSVKTELGISKAWGPWTVEIAPSVRFFSDNTDFNRGNTLSQDPFYSVQGHLIYGFPSGMWLALNGTYFSGGRTTLNGVRGNNMQQNTRGGLTFAMPVDRHNSIKVYLNNGTSTRTGSDFDAVGVFWQYRWGEGF
jgi:hypothetical protein